MKLIKSLLLLLMLLLMPAVASAASATLKIDKNGRGNIGVGDRFYILVELHSVTSDMKEPPAVPGCKVIYCTPTMFSQQASYNGTHSSVSISALYTITVRAEKEGTFTMGPVTIAGVKTNKITYTIGAAGSSAQPSSSSNASSSADDPYDNQAVTQSGPKFIGTGNNHLFLRASVSKTNAYEQEAIVYTVKLYCSYNRLSFIGATTAPKFEGFVVEESKDISTQWGIEDYNGRSYRTAIIARYIIFPQMKGTLAVKGNTYTVSVSEDEYYSDPFWGRFTVGQPVQLNVTPNDLSINVKPLPQPQPADFSGGVGKFSISSSLPSSSLKANEAAQINYTVSGTGNLKYIKLPDLSTLYGADFEVYSPTTEVKSNVSASNVSGSVTFDYSFLPVKEGELIIPDVKLVYFNPETGSYETAVARGYKVKVGKGEASDKSQTNTVKRFNPDLLEIGGRTAADVALLAVWWYWTLYFILLAVLVTAVIYYRRHLKLNADQLSLRSRRAGKEARKRLAKAAKCMTGGKTEQFYDEILAALWGYLRDKLKIPNSELNRENVSQALAGHNISDSVINNLIELIDRCEFAKYAPGNTSLDMENVYNSAAEIINSLEEAQKTQAK